MQGRQFYLAFVKGQLLLTALLCSLIRMLSLTWREVVGL